jgi:hypothetical protein
VSAGTRAVQHRVMQKAHSTVSSCLRSCPQTDPGSYTGAVGPQGTCRLHAIYAALGHQASCLSCYRSTVHPHHLSSGYDTPDDHIKTLYDCIETTISRHPEVGSAPLGPAAVSVTQIMQSTPDIMLSRFLLIAKNVLCLSVQAPYLGERQVNSQGEPGPYKWTTYKRVG